MSVEEATENSPLFPDTFKGNTTPQKYYSLTSSVYTASGLRTDRKIPDEKQVNSVLSALDDRGRWFTRQVSISNPYIGDGTKTELTDEYASTNVGDETDTSEFRDESDQEYISTITYIDNMRVLLNYVAGEE